MTTIEKLRALARELAGEAWDYDHRPLGIAGRSLRARGRRLPTGVSSATTDLLGASNSLTPRPRGTRSDTERMRAWARAHGGLSPLFSGYSIGPRPQGIRRART